MTAIYNMCQTHSNFHLFNFHVLFYFVYWIIYEIKSLQNFMLHLLQREFPNLWYIEVNTFN